MTPSLLLEPNVRPAFGAEHPRVRSVPGTGAWSAADDVLLICETAVHLGGTLTLMPWQKNLLGDILSVRPDGKWAGRDHAYLVARQNGKGGVLHALALAGLFLFDDVREILHSAHEVKTAKKAFRELKALIKDTPHLHAKVERRGSRVVGFRHSNEDVSITIQDTPGDPDSAVSVIRFIARATNTGRGFSPQWLIIDEAQICNEEAREAIFYSTRAQANPLRVWCGTAPKPSDPSDVFTALRDRGRAGGDPHMSWNEWSVEPTVNIEDLREPVAYAEAVAGSNPALGVLLDWETADSERASAVSDEAWEGLCREALSWWPDEDGADPWGFVSRYQWAACASAETGKRAEKPGWFTGPVALGIEVDQERAGATISVSGDCREGGIGIQVGSVGPVADVVPEVLRRLADKTKPISHVVVDPGSPAGALIGDLEAAGVTVTQCKYADLVKATGDLYDAVIECDVVYRDPGGELTAAVAGGVRRPAGDSWLIDRKKGADVSALGAVTLARWGHLQPVEPEPYAAVVYA